MTDRFSSLLLSTRLQRHIFCLCCVLILIPVCGAFAASSSDRETEKVKIEQGIKKNKINIRRLEEGIEKQQEHIEITQKQEREVLAELQDIDARLFEQQGKLEVLESRI